VSESIVTGGGIALAISIVVIAGLYLHVKGLIHEVNQLRELQRVFLRRDQLVKMSLKDFEHGVTAPTLRDIWAKNPLPWEKKSELIP
jgi:hypothetical protein